MSKEDDTQDSNVLVADTLLGSMLRQNCEALSSEIAAARRNPGRNFEVSDGKCIHSGEDGHLYSFNSDVSLPIPPESPIQLQAENDETIPGLLLSQQNFEVVLQLSQSIGQTVRKAKVSSEPWFILKKLRDRLESLQDEDAAALSISEAVLGLRTTPQDRSKQAEESALAILQELGTEQLLPNTAQLRSIGACCGSPLHFIWGPPGTGKTANVAQVVRTLVAQGERVMVMAHANVAVDVAMLRVSDVFSGQELLKDGKVVRIGVPQLPEIRDRDEVLPEGILKRSQPHLIREKSQLESQQQKLLKALAAEDDSKSKKQLRQQLRETRLKLKAIKKQIQEATTTLINEAAVVGCTLSKFSLDDQIHLWPADAVVVDEVSMAPFPMVLSGAARAGSRLLIFGDFRQLPPIHLSTSKDAATWLGRDAFEVAGVKDRIDDGQDDERVTLLDTQYRMASPICDVVSRLAYDQRLRSDSSVESRVAPILARHPWPDESLILLDTSDLAPACLQDPKPGSYSRINPIHACLGATLANEALLDGIQQVAIITPYTSQARLVSSFCRKLGKNEVVTASTVHRFQGSERDMVIVDLTDAPLQRSASQLTGSDVEKSLRLLNVAISRARGKLVVLAHLEFIKKHHPKSSPSRTVVNLLSQHGVALEATPGSFFDGRETGWLKWLDWIRAEDLLSRALATTTGAACLNIPESFKISAGLTRAIQDASLRLPSMTIFCPVSVAQQLEGSSADLRLKNRPGGFFALIDSDLALLGGHSPSGVFAAIEDNHIRDVLAEQLLGASLTIPKPNAHAEETLEELFGRCPECGESRRLREMTRGEWVLRCNEARHPFGPLTADILEDAVLAMGVRCSECGSKAEAKLGRHGLFLSCAGFKAGCTGRPPNLRTLFGGD